MDTSLRELYIEFKEYINNPEYVFKSCGDDKVDKRANCREWIIIMKKIEDTRTTESRIVKDIKFAKYRASHLQVVLIVNKFDFTKTLYYIYNYFNGKRTKYKEGEIVYPDSFDDSNKICSNGIHYFTSIEPAYYYGIETCENYTGDYVSWYDDGQLKSMKQYY